MSVDEGDDASRRHPMLPVSPAGISAHPASGTACQSYKVVGERGSGVRHSVDSTGSTQADRIASQSMIPKKPAPDLIRGRNRFSERIMLKQESETMIPIQPGRIAV
jgi:hypothetical protein